MSHDRFSFQEQIRFDRVKEGKRKLWNLYKTRMQSISEEEQNDVKNTLIFGESFPDHSHLCAIGDLFQCTSWSVVLLRLVG